MTENKMMKGFHGMVNAELIAFINEAMAELSTAWASVGDDVVENNPDKLIKLLMDEYNWIHENDRFGNKAYKTTSYPASTPPLPTDEFRITLVNPKGQRAGCLYVDVRAWGRY